MSVHTVYNIIIDWMGDIDSKIHWLARLVASDQYFMDEVINRIIDRRVIKKNGRRLPCEEITPPGRNAFFISSKYDFWKSDAAGPGQCTE